MMLNTPREDDVIHVVKDIQVAYDPQIAELVKEMTLDYARDDEGAGLVISSGGSCC